jgi:preprotein translocase subunit SecG
MLKEKLKQYKKNFFTVNEKELTRTSKILMGIFFVVSILILQQGIYLNLNQAEPPSVQYGYRCVDFGYNQRDLQLNHFTKYHNNDKGFGKNKTCQEMKNKFVNITNDIHIQSEIEQIDILNQKLSNIRSEQSRINKQYSNMLLEKIANQKQEESILKTRSDSAKKELDKLSRQSAKITEIIKEKGNVYNYKKIREFKIFLDKNSEKILDGLNSARKWYTVKRSGQILAFLIPVWFLFFWLFRKLTTKKKFVFAHLSFYVSNAAAFLLLIELIHIIYIVMPKVFLGKLIAFLISMNLGIILNVIGIFFFLGLFGFIIMRVQKNASKKAKTKDKRVLNVKNGKCYNCSTLRKNEKFCFNCGETQFQKCECGKDVLRFSSYCGNCGNKLL